MLAIVALVVFVVLAGPWLWLVVLFVVEAIVWVLLAAAGVTAAVVLRRPWNVVILDESGEQVASQQIEGRRAAARHAATVRRRLEASPSAVDPAAAVRHT